MIDSDIEKKEKEVVDAILRFMDEYYDYCRFNYFGNTLQIFDGRNLVLDIPIKLEDLLYKFNKKRPIFIRSSELTLKGDYPYLNAKVSKLCNDLESKGRELQIKKQKELTRLDEVHTMLTGLIYGGNN